LSYSWVLHSLWDLNQEVDGNAFPVFLDQDSVYYIIEVKFPDHYHIHVL